MKTTTFGFAITLIMTGCVSNQAVQTVQAGDNNMSCPAIKAELGQLGATFEEVKDDSGITGKNVGLAIVFWPGIIVNEVRSNKNQDSIDGRITHLSSVYNGKCLDENSSGDQSSSSSVRLQELKDLHGQGLLNDNEYQAARERAIRSL